MSKAIEIKKERHSEISRVEQVLIGGDLSQLTTAERESYYLRICETLALNPITRPFDYITFQGKLMLYANKGCAEQLRSIRKISISVTEIKTVGDLYVVNVTAKGKSGRQDSSIGAISVHGLKGEALANAMMKAETKAKRRVTLSICGLNMLDETEVNETDPSSGEKAALSTVAPIKSETVTAPKSALIEKPTDPEPKTRVELSNAIVKQAAKLTLTTKEMTEWVQEEFGKPMKQISLEEMKKFLEMLYREEGRNGVQS